ncbi:MAG TPA: hypothetical protein DEB50_05580 [Desulfobacter sp.]|jgi:predicted ABC-type ATPase|nr:hypothetical protein [Desulfobacter sp.]
MLGHKTLKCYIIAGPNGAGKTRGHSVPEDVIIRRYSRGWNNLQKHYKQIVDDWIIFDNSGDQPLIMEEKQ